MPGLGLQSRGGRPCKNNLAMRAARSARDFQDSLSKIENRSKTIKNRRVRPSRGQNRNLREKPFKMHSSNAPKRHPDAFFEGFSVLA